MRLFLLVLVLAGCAPKAASLDRALVRGRAMKVGAPIERVGAVPVHGAHVVVDRVGGFRVKGELIAADPTRLVVLTDATYAQEIPVGDVQALRVRTAEPQQQVPGLWGAAGVLSTPTHGFLLLFSAPTWVVATTAAAVDRHMVSWTTVQPAAYPDLWQWARFPAGVPQGWAEANGIAPTR